jgi:hypothetical protein
VEAQNHFCFLLLPGHVFSGMFLLFIKAIAMPESKAPGISSNGVNECCQAAVDYILEALGYDFCTPVQRKEEPCGSPKIIIVAARTPTLTRPAQIFILLCFFQAHTYQERGRIMYVLDKDITGHPALESAGTVVPVSGNWSINEIPNGGYLMALVANAMLQQSTKKRIAILTAAFIARSAAGQSLVRVEKIAASTQFERYEARLLQNQTEKVRALGTFVDEDMACTVNRYEAAPAAIAPLDQCIPIPRMNHFTLYDQIQVRLDPACAGWMNLRYAEISEFKGWIKFRDERPYDALSLLVAADAFPPPVYASQGLAAWVPTLEMSVNIRKLPAGPWLKCFFRTRFITCGLAEEDGEIWDEADELVLLSRQIAQYRPF